MTNSSIQLPSGEITVFANEEKNLPTLTNNSYQTIKVQIQAEGKWSYGGKDAFANQVDGDGNTAQTGRNSYMRFPNITPAALVAVKNNEPVASGKNQIIELEPGEQVAFVNNDQPGVYDDNTGSLLIKWSIAGIINNKNSDIHHKSVTDDNNNASILLPQGEIIVFANEEKELHSNITKEDEGIFNIRIMIKLVR